MGLAIAFLIAVVLVLIAAIPCWSHSKAWGYGPSGGLVVIVALLVLDWL